MGDLLYSKSMTVNELQHLVKQLHFPADTLFLAEQLPTHIVTKRQDGFKLLSFEVFTEQTEFLACTSGRLFHGKAELRWERSGEQVRVVYLCEGDDQNEGLFRDYNFATEILDEQRLEKDTTHTYYLFGERLRDWDVEKLAPLAQAGDFAELRIPRLLRYPLGDQSGRRARLRVCEYRSVETGRIEYFRFVSLQAEGMSV